MRAQIKGLLETIALLYKNLFFILILSKNSDIIPYMPYCGGMETYMNIAILGFGVVGRGVADLLSDNLSECKRLGGGEINIKYILDLRDFPGTPYESLVVHDFSVIENDGEVDCIIEVMGGSHPAYEYTLAALRAGKHVITSNKEVVANYGEEFLRAAAENGVSYRFEAAVGGGIPVIAPLCDFMKQNKISEVRGILNGTTNYILTRMFTYSDSFETALADAQKRGYAERNPDADILGTDAARKIAILGAICSEKMIPTDEIHTEGIVNIRENDVSLAKLAGYSIKLLGRYVSAENGAFVFVAPHLIPEDSLFTAVNGVYNAVEVVGEPIGNVVFYGKGAGAGATASAVVGDLMQAMRRGAVGQAVSFEKSCDYGLDFSEFSSKSFVVTDASPEAVAEIFGKVRLIPSDNETAFITESAMTEPEFAEKEQELTDDGARVLSRIRVLQ